MAEKYDFGTPQKINSLYGALLKVTPFSKDEAKYYEGILRDRNLVVHHGGILTLRYLEQNKQSSHDKVSRAFFDSLVITPSYFDERLMFIKGIAHKILKATHSPLRCQIENVEDCHPERLKAVDSFLSWGDEIET